MDIEKVYEFSAGKNDWNTFEIGVKDDTIVVRDDVGMVQFVEEDIDQLVEGIDQARRHLREKQRRPTASSKSTEDTSEPDEPEDDTEDEDEDGEDDGIQSTGLGPQFPGSGQGV